MNTNTKSLAWLFLPFLLLLLPGCSILTEKLGPDAKSCEDIQGPNVCKDDIIAYCYSGEVIRFEVCSDLGMKCYYIDGDIGYVCSDECGSCNENEKCNAQGECECKGNWNPVQDCAFCKNHWVDNGDDCGTCPGNWNPVQDCVVCKNHWMDNGDDCGTCTGNWDLARDCAFCKNHWVDNGDDCGTCPGHWYPMQDCAFCMNHWVDDGNNCGTCPGNWNPVQDCVVCKNHWMDNGDDCGTCTGNWDLARDCAFCKNHWVDNGDDCGTCPSNWDPMQDCNACEQFWGDCNLIDADGCETPLNTISDCGSCDIACNLANAAETCSTGQCLIQSCNFLWGNCDGMHSNGCEIDLGNNASHCGICSNSCGQNAHCTSGNCVCNTGFSNCDGDWGNGCEINTDTDLNNCGSCFYMCERDNASEKCIVGSCSIDQCDSPWGNCDGVDINGCEALLESIVNCGSCGTICSRANAMATCAGGNCHIDTCNPLWDDCDFVDSNGCETSLETPTDCGSCGVPCSAPGATTTCAGGSCSIATCDPGLGDCDGTLMNGCENTLDSLTDCGECGSACIRGNATASCFGDVCHIDNCNFLWGNCNLTDADGCETSLETLTDCGSCGSACSRANATASCLGGSCNIQSCDALWGNCDGIDANGCEADFVSDANNCGTCGNICQVAGEVCYSGACCMPDCTGKPSCADDGCGKICGVCTGFLSWAKRAGGISGDSGNDISTLSDGSSVVTGLIQGTVTFGQGEANETTLTSAGSEDIFVARYNPDGTFAWARHDGGSNYGGSEISTLSDGSSVVTGYFYGTATFGLGEANETTLTSAGEGDIFVAKCNPDGTLTWARRAGGSGHDGSCGISTMSDGSSVVTGRFQSSAATFGLGEANETTLTSAGSDDIFVAKYNPDGTLTWARRDGGSGYGEVSFGVSTMSDGSSVVTGTFSFSGTATFGLGEANETTLTSAGEGDIFVAKYNPDGTLTWARRAGGSGHDGSYGISTMSDGSSVVTGDFQGTATFGQGEANETTLMSAGVYDLFVARYNNDGTLAWASRAGGSNSDVGKDISILSDGSSVVTGYFNGNATFGQGEANETTLTSAGGCDVFVAKYNPDGALTWAHRVGGSDEEYSFGISTLSDGSSVVIGRFQSSATFGQGEANETTLTSAGGGDIFVMRLDP